MVRRGVLLASFVALALLVLTSVAGAAKDDLDLVSRASGASGVKANSFAFRPAISSDGRFVAFDSIASNLDPADGDATNDVFVRDLQANATTLVSRASGASGAKGNADSLLATISGDGRFVAFLSSASNLVAADPTPDEDVFVRDMQTNTTTLVSRASGATGAKANNFSDDAAISADGSFVAFTSQASNLSAEDGDLTRDVFVRDLHTNATTLVSRTSGGAGAAADADSNTAAISADGRFVAFTSFGSNLDAADPFGDQDVFVRDLQANTTTLVSRATGAAGAAGNSSTNEPAISADGRFVAFASDGRLDPADGDTNIDVYVRDLQQNTTTLVSRATGAAGAKANDNSIRPTISGDGRFVAFASFAPNLDPNGDNGRFDVFVRDLHQNTTTLASRAAGAAGAIANGDSFRSAISGDGRFVAFDSTASNLSPADGDATFDVFRREVLGGPSSPPPDTTAPRISIGGVPSTCTRHDFSVQVRIRDGSPLRFARLFLDGTRKFSTTSNTFSVRIRASRLRAGRHRITVTARDAAGNGASRSVGFRRCS